VLRWRLLVSALMIAPLVGLLVLDYRCNFGVPGIWLWPLPVLFTLLGVAEVLDLLAAKNHRPAAWSVYAGAALVIGASLVPLFSRAAGEATPDPLATLAWPLAALVVAIALAFVAEMARYRQPGGVIVNVALAVFAVAYVAVLMTFLNALRGYHDNGWGMAAVVSLIRRLSVRTMPRPASASISCKTIGGFNTTPGPITFITPGLSTPLGIWCNLYTCPSTTTVWPALAPP